MKGLSRIILMAVILLGCYPFQGQSRTERITQEEFDCYLHTVQTGFSIQKSWELFVERKLKAADVKSRGWDTLPSFAQWCKAVQGQLLKQNLLSSLPPQAVGTCSALLSYRVEQWILPLPQHLTQKEADRAIVRMDSLYLLLNRGIVQKEYKDCRHTTGWYTQETLLKEVWEQVVSLPLGTVSSPFLSPLGVHLVRVLGKQDGTQKTIPTLEEKERTLNAQKEICAHYLSAPSSRMRALSIQDSLLAVCWEAAYQHEVRTRLVEETELENYFHHHQSDYEWEFPHFKGAIVFCENKKEASRIKRILKKRNYGEWEAVLAQWKQENPSSRVRMETGLFQIGKNPYVDKLAFKCGSLPKSPASSYIFVVGKRLKNHPESYRDVYDNVRKDYEKYLYDRKIQELKQRFPLEIAPEVLKTVNCSGSN